MSAAPATLRRGFVLAAGLACGALLGPGCIHTQKWPGPMTPTVDPLPPGDSQVHLPGPEEVTVVRHADPVKIRPAGTASGIPMTFYDKRTRMRAGGQVIVAAGGRAEVLWPAGTSIVLFGRGVGWIGSPSRGEPMFDFREVERARLELHEGDQVRLIGGALLTGASGPYLLERRPSGTIWVHNQSRGPLSISFREDAFELGPGQAVVLPLLSSGGTPFSADQALRQVPGPGFSVSVRGGFEPVEDEGGVRLRGSEGPAEREAQALGVAVLVGPGEEVRFGGLDRPTGPGGAVEQAPRPAPNAAPAPAPDGAPAQADPEVPTPEETEESATTPPR